MAQGAAFNDATMIVSGGQQGIELACKVFCDEGDTVLCENPTFIGSLTSFRSNGATPVGVEMEADGISPSALERAIRENPRTKLIYLIPTFQNPTGITTPAHKRREIYAVAQKYGIPILEDNPYGELRFAGEEVPTLKSMDEDGLVIYCSSFSKILSAGMRLGFVVAPEQIISKMAVAKQGEDVHTNIFFQMLCHRYMTECDLDSHIQGIRDLYRRKCELMLTALENEMPQGFTFTRPEGGLFLWGTLPEGVDMTAFVQAALERKVAVVPGTAFSCDTNVPSRSFRLNYSTPSDEQIAEGAKRLGEAARAIIAKNS
jgi:2-aminoadipate transaminase